MALSGTCMSTWTAPTFIGSPRPANGSELRPFLRVGGEQPALEQRFLGAGRTVDRRQTTPPFSCSRQICRRVWRRSRRWSSSRATDVLPPGILMGGLDGTDEWRVDCSDSGSWQLWFNNDGGTEVDRCSDAKCS